MFLGQKAKEIVSSIKPVQGSMRVIDVGCGSGWLIPHLQDAGVHDILGVDGSEKLLASLEKTFPSPGILGNEPGVRLWMGNFVDIPDYLGSVDAVFMNAIFASFDSQRNALLKAVSLMQPLGRIVVYHPLGKASLRESLQGCSGVKDLPSLKQWKEMIADMPLEVLQFEDEEDCYLTVLQIPESCTFPRAPIYLQGEVIPGRGIGSAKLGVPTANLKPDSFQKQLKDMPKGVYFGWVQLKGEDVFGVYKAVLNLGSCPTLKEDEHEISLEAHILHAFDKDFYGQTMEVILTGYLRPEMKFSGVQQLLDQIRSDIGKAKNQLNQEALRKIMEGRFAD